MNPLKSHQIETPSFFTRQEMESLFANKGLIAQLRDKLEDESERCYKLAEQLYEDVDPEVDDEAEIARQSLALEFIGEQLDGILDTFDIGETMCRGELLTWKPPKGSNDSVEWDRVIAPPQLERYKSYIHPLAALLDYKEGIALIGDDIEQDLMPPWNPGLLFFKPEKPLPTTPESVREFASHRIGELEDLDKNLFRDCIIKLAEVGEHYRNLLGTHGSELPEILELLNHPSIRAVYEPSASHGRGGGLN